MISKAKEVAEYAVASAGITAPFWFENINWVLSILMAVSGILFMWLKIYYIIKNKGKTE